MKAALKLLLPLLILSTALSTLLFTSGCKDDLLTSGDTTTVANPNLKVYRNISINEFFNSASFSSINLNDGAVVDADNPIRDAELADSTGQSRDRFYLRSGDGTQDFAIGQETKFVPFFGTKSATYTQAQFDAISRIDAGHSDPLVPADFYKYSTFSLGRTFVSDDVRVYGFWLKGKKVNYGLSNEVYGLIYLKSIETVTPIGGVPSYRLTVDVKVNQGGFNDFRDRVPVSVTN